MLSGLFISVQADHKSPLLLLPSRWASRVPNAPSVVARLLGVERPPTTCSPTPEARQPARSALAVLDVGPLSARALRDWPSTWPSQWLLASVSGRAQRVVTGAAAATGLSATGLEAAGRSGDASLEVRFCTQPAGCHRKRHTTIELGGPPSWAHALQGFSGLAGAANTAVRSTEVRQAALARLPHLASSSSIIWNRPPHAENHAKPLTSPTHCMCSRALCAARRNGEHRQSTGHCSR